MNLSVPTLPLVVAALAAFAIGFMWHGPLFGATWLKLMKITPVEIEKGQKEMSKKMPFYMLAAFVQQLVLAYVISVLVQITNATEPVSAILLAFLLWLGFIATALLNAVLWEGRTISFYLFELAYHLVSFVVITLIVSMWR